MGDMLGNANKNSSALVSIVVAVYNSAKYLRQAMESILNQSYSDIEVIAVDDGSSDGSLEILYDLASHDHRLTVYENHEESDGAAVARNIGISHATGKYLMVLDSDDFFEKDMIEKLCFLAEENAADVVICDGYRYDDRNGVDLERNSILYRDKLPADARIFAPEENKDNLFVMTLGAAWNVLFSLQLIRKYDLMFKSFHHADDFELVYMAFAHAEKIMILPERLVHYRVNHAGSQAANVDCWPDTAWKAMLSFKKALMAAGLFETYRVAFLRVAARYVSFYINSMSSEQSFIKLFDELKNERLDELGLKTARSEEIDDDGLYGLIRLLNETSAAGYLFRKMKGVAPFDRAVAWKAAVPENSAVAIWGADRIGTDVFYSIFWNRDYKPVIWVDRQYKEMGYPICDPEELKNAEFDHILVIARSNEQWEQVLQQLTEMGIGSEKAVCV